MLESLERIRDVRRISFNCEQKAAPYVTMRGLFERISPLDGKIEGYVDLLPKFKGKSVVEIIEEKIRRNKLVRLLDLGCGNGYFLRDCKLRWGANIECVGITAFPYHELRFIDTRTWKEDPPLAPELQKLGVKIMMADVQSLNYIHDFDVATAVNVAGYLGDPPGFVKGMHRALREGGVGLIHGIVIPFGSQDEVKSFLCYLKIRYGFVFGNNEDQATVAFKKGNNRLNLPLMHYAGVRPVCIEPMRQNRQILVYGHDKFKPTIAERFMERLRA